MTPVILLTDGYLANGAEPWRIPNVEELPPIAVEFRTRPEGFQPFLRDPRNACRALGRFRARRASLHRIGGLEKDFDTGHISYDPDNHEKMCRTARGEDRQHRQRRAGAEIDLGDESGKLLVLGWGSTYGAIREAVRRCRERGLSVSHAHLRLPEPVPEESAATLLRRFERVLIPEMNLGQLVRS